MIFASTNENKEVFEKYIEVCSKIKNQLKIVNGDKDKCNKVTV